MVATNLADVLALLELERADEDVFRPAHPGPPVPRVFGGQVLAQSLRAASATLPAGRLPHSLHAYFLRPGDSAVPLTFAVTRLRDGRSVSSRRVTVTQRGRTIFEMLTSAGELPVDSAAHRPIPVVPGPSELSTLQHRLRGYADELDGWWVRPRPFDLRYVASPPRAALDEDGPHPPRNQLWLRPVGTVPNDPIVRRCLLAYVSDMTLLDSVLRSRRRTTLGPGSVASLDHAMWFHAEPDLSGWTLYDQHSPGSSSRRGLCQGYLYSEDGELVSTVVQEGYLSPAAPRGWAGPRLEDRHSATNDPGERLTNSRL